MYLNHYQLKLMPFEIGPDPKFLWLGSKHKEAFSALRYGILESKGFIVIIGDPGTGKSTLLNATAANFGSNIRFAKITDPALNEMDFFNFAANAFEMGKTFRSKAEFLIEFGQFVKDAGAQSKKVILVIDEAQRLTADMLEQIRVFSNVETPGQKVVSCIFAGQTEFLDMVKQNRALAQRVFFSHIIQPLTQLETGDYIKHRLKVAGTEVPIFTLAAVQEVFRLTGGIPRLINVLCDQALLSGYVLDKKTIGPELIKESTENTLITSKTHKEPAEAQIPDLSGQSTTSATEPIAEHTAELALDAPEKTDSSDRKTAYWVLVALTVILTFAAFFFLNDGFRTAILNFITNHRLVQNGIQSADPTPGSDEIGRLQGQMLELRGQKDNAETQLRELQVQLGSLDKDKEELKTALAELQKQLENAGPAPDRLKAEVDTLKTENTRLQTQLVEITHQKGAAEVRLSKIEKEYTGLAADAKGLKSARDRVDQLEAAMSERDKKLIQVEQKIGELEKALVIEKAAKDKMGVELASRHDAIVNLQKRHETARSVQLKLESDIQNSQQENTRLQSQLHEAKAQKPAPAPALAPTRARATSQPPHVSSETGGAAPDPAGAIDYVIKRKSQ